MTIFDWVFTGILAISMIVGVFRGFVKEAVSVGSLLIAVWAAFHFAPVGETLLLEWIGSGAARVWVARIGIFTLVLMLGGLAGWSISRFINQVGMSGIDRLLGLGFGLLRGAIICGLAAIVAPYLELDRDAQWQESRLLPYVQTVADGIAILAPKALDYFREELAVPRGEALVAPEGEPDTPENSPEEEL
ncbi:MAG: CvpA family protein [Pseudomonadota bacterium]